MSELEQTELEQKVNKIIAQKEGYNEVEIPLEEQERYLSKYSFSALTCNMAYYWYMKDTVFFWISIVSSFLFFPVLAFLPFMARRRAWQMREWRSFSHFQSVQKKWDKASFYGLIIFIIIFTFLVDYEIKIVSNLMSQNGLNNMDDVRQLQNDMQSTLGS